MHTYDSYQPIISNQKTWVKYSMETWVNNGNMGEQWKHG